ncbi:cache domain-containing protein [Roseibium sp. FZY0029]|uniref:cache domain-containing protein n=1 Tax=Roseibium sp. FZY0029 TaxID=3116647 RepID=UPI002EBCACCB|nr:cache domain-containing protein [Roseibium sp. FZY0029]
MREKHARSGYPSLVVAVCGFVALGGVIAVLTAWSFVGQRLEESRDSALAEAVSVRGKGVALEFARELYQDWRNLRVIAVDMTGRGETAIRTALDMVVAGEERISWAGLASVDGTVLTASASMLEGTDVSSSPWFRNGLGGDFAGDVLQADLTPTAGNDQRRFLDMATPVTDEFGEVEGVLAFHINHQWVEQYLAESAHSMGLEVYVIDRTGSIVARTDGLSDPIDKLQSFRSAMTGARQTRAETWPDGTTYFTTVIPDLGYADLPAFGWSMIARVNNSAHPIGDFTNVFIAYFVTLGIVLAALTTLFILIFVRPFRRLANSARAVMRGDEIYPYEAKTTTEANVLSAAVARLQNVLHP